MKDLLTGEQMLFTELQNGINSKQRTFCRATVSPHGDNMNLLILTPYRLKIYIYPGPEGISINNMLDLYYLNPIQIVDCFFTA